MLSVFHDNGVPLAFFRANAAFYAQVFADFERLFDYSVNSVGRAAAFAESATDALFLVDVNAFDFALSFRGIDTADQTAIRALSATRALVRGYFVIIAVVFPSFFNGS